MEKDIIIVNNLTKKFWIPKKVNGFFPKLINIFFRKKEHKTILKNISFKIKKSEIIGYIGMNGAGKSTTIKILTGIYPPTEGQVKCLEKDPFKERSEYVKDIGVVFGNRNLLDYDIAPIYSLELYGAIYNIEPKILKQRINEFAKRLKVDHLLHIPVRKLSLGETMKFNIIASLLHKPKIIFLDEPTIGLDLIAREEIIQFLKELNKKYKTTIILTTHNMDNIEELCDRVIIIDKGKKIYDGSLKKLKNKFANYKIITIEYKNIKNNIEIKDLEIIEKEKNIIKIKSSIEKLDVTINNLIKKYEIIDLIIQDLELKKIIKHIYEKKKFCDFNAFLQKYTT